MRLLHIETFQMREFYNSTPSYAILSHTWDEGEMTLQDMQAAYPNLLHDDEPGLLKTEDHSRSSLPSWLATMKRSFRKPREAEKDDLAIRQLKAKPGHAKILGFCEVARKQDFEWVWVDTCCIDKTSSAELSEAINSMWMWYKQSSTCYVYLADVEAQPPGWHLDEQRSQNFCNSRWFTRGWTLQELVAPTYVDFFSNNCM